MVPETAFKYFVRFMGVGAKTKNHEKSTEIKRFELDELGNQIPKSIREYIFPMEEWVEIQEQDRAFFKKKSDANPHWESDKRIVVIESKKEIQEKAEAEAKLKATIEAKLKTEAEAKLKAEEEAKLKIEEEAKLKAEIEAKLVAEVKAKEEAEAKLKEVTE